MEFLPKSFVEEPFYTVAEAMRLTGFTATKFRYQPNKEELDKRGSDVSGRVWRIPRSALIDMGWLNPDAPMFADLPNDGEEIPVRRSVKRIHELAGQVDDLKAQLVSATNRAEIAEALVKAKDAELANLYQLLRK